MEDPICKAFFRILEWPLVTAGLEQLVDPGVLDMSWVYLYLAEVCNYSAADLVRGPDSTVQSLI